MFWVAVGCEIGRACVSRKGAPFYFFSCLFSSNLLLKGLAETRGKSRQYFAEEETRDISALRIDKALFEWYCATQAATPPPYFPHSS